MANLARLEGLPIDRLSGSSGGWTQTPGFGSPDGVVGGPKPILLMAPRINLESDVGNFHGFRPGFAGTIKAVLYRVVEVGAGAGGDMTIQPRIAAVNVTGGERQLLVAAVISGQWYWNDTVISAANVFGPTDQIDLKLTEATAYTSGAVEVVLVVEPK